MIAILAIALILAIFGLSQFWWVLAFGNWKKWELPNFEIEEQSLVPIPSDPSPIVFDDSIITSALLNGELNPLKVETFRYKPYFIYQPKGLEVTWENVNDEVIREMFSSYAQAVQADVERKIMGSE